MSNKRKRYPKAIEVELLAQVDRRCPICGEPLFRKRKQRHTSIYELAHIYPLNPTVFEAELLRDVPRLTEDPNHPDNLVPLCRTCHKQFDSPRTVKGYHELHKLKQDLVGRALQHGLQIEHPLDAEITRVIVALHAEDQGLDSIALEYDAKKLEVKFDETMSPLLRHKIRSAVSQYYPQVKRELLRIERENPTATDVIASQIKLYYMQQRRLALGQTDIFRNMVDWIRFRSSPAATEAAEVVAAYYVQNCEVFE